MNIKSSLLIACAMIITPVPALAIPGNSGNGNGGCGVGETTNGCSGDDTTSSTGNVNNTIDNKVNNDIDISNKLAATLTNSNTNTVNNRNNVDIDNTNKNVNDNQNTNTNTNTNNNSNDNSNVNHNNATAASNQTQVQSQGQSQSTSNSNNSSVVVQGDRYPASTAIAPALVAGSDTCMGSSSAGGQGMSFGFSFGTSWTDKNCVRLKNARQLQSMGFGEAAMQLMCQSKDVQEAMRVAGTPCAAIRRRDD